MPAVLFANGATGTLEHNLPLAIELGKHGVACFLFDFGGQGGSAAGGDPRRDLRAAVEILRRNPRVDDSRLGAVGHSLGARLVSELASEFRAEVLFGNLSEQDSPNILLAYSRFEFLFDPPRNGSLAVGPWTDHLTGPLDPVLLRASLDWLGAHLDFQPVHPLTEPLRILARAGALLGGTLIVLAAVLLLTPAAPEPAGTAPIPFSFLWVTAAGTLILPVLLLRRVRPVWRLSGRSRWLALSCGAAFFVLIYLLSVAAFSWSYFNVALYARKLLFFFGMGGAFTLISWHDQTLLHGEMIERLVLDWRLLWAAALRGAAGRWFAAALVFGIVLGLGGRVGIWMILVAICFLTFCLEGLAAALSTRARHPLAGATFLGLTWSWLWTVFLPF